MRRGCAVLVLMACMAAGCTEAGRVGNAPTRPSADSAAPACVCDWYLFNRLQHEAGRLIDKGKTTPLDELRAGLAHGSCTLPLASPSPGEMAPPEIYARCGESVLVLAGVWKCDKCDRWHLTISTGFVITAAGAFVTNYHVVDNAKHVTLVAMTNDGTVVPVREVLAASKEDDVAILRIDAGQRRFQPLVLSTDAPVGSSVCVISHPARRFYSLTRGIVSRYFLVAADEKRAVPRMHITADFARGSSGGPLFNERGAVVGFVKSTASIYYDVSDGKKDSLQMVFKECIPASQVLKLIGKK